MNNYYFSICLSVEEGLNARNELAKSEHAVLILVESLEHQLEVALDGVHIVRLAELPDVVNRHVALRILVASAKRQVWFYPEFIQDALSDKLNTDLTLDETSDEFLEQVAGLALEVLIDWGLSAVEATTALDQGRVLLFAGHEAIAYFSVVEMSISVFVKLVENDKDLILCNHQPEVVSDACI